MRLLLTIWCISFFFGLISVRLLLFSQAKRAGWIVA